MKVTPNADARLEALWAHHHGQLRDPHQIVVHWAEARDLDPSLFDSRATGHWWNLLDQLKLTLLVTREYEHLVLALSAPGGRKRVSYLHLPHPNGMTVDVAARRVVIASTRNPNVIFDFAPSTGAAPGRAGDDRSLGTLMPTQSRFYPGCLYMHDIALIGGKLYANAVGLDAIVELKDRGQFEPVWWPRSIDSKSGPRFDRNYLQLNSIAAGATLAKSYFGASVPVPSRRRPGHLNFAVDRRGVVFSGATRDVCGTGLTRPHSARLRGRELWIDNSGYGELGRIVAGKFEPFARLPGWTRGLYFHGNLAFVGTSRVIPKYAHYAPGLKAHECRSGVHCVDLTTGKIVGSLFWPNGNQLFAIEAVPQSMSPGFPFLAPSHRQRGDGIVRSFGENVAA